MHWEYAPCTLPLFSAPAIAVALAFFIWRRHKASGAPALMALVLAAAVWSLGYALELTAADLANKLFWAKVQYLGIATIPLAWLIFAFQYSNRDQWLTGRNLALLGIIPSITVLLVWTNEWHALVWSRTDLGASGSFPALDLTHGPWFWVNWLFSYALLLPGSILLFWVLLRLPHLYRWQVGVALIGVLLPWLGNGLYASGLGPVPNLDLTPLAFTLSGIAFALGLLRYRLLDIIPVARRAIVDSMSEGVMVLDAQERIVDLNPAMQRLIGFSAAEAIGKSAARLFADYAELAECFHSAQEAYLEVTLRSDPLRTRLSTSPQGDGDVTVHYEVRVSPVTDHKQRPLGRLVMLRDITIRKQAEAALRAAHDELDRRVQERTQELSQANQALQAEIAERRRAEQALKQSEEKYRLLAENVTDVIWATDLNLHFIYVSPSVFGLCGYTAEEIVDRSIDEILTPASVQIATATLAEELAREQGSPTLDPARSVIIELEQIRKGGGVVPIEIKVTFLRNTTGQPVGVLGVTRDITQRRQAEELVRASLREKETLLQEIHHRVKNNLQVISSLLNLQSAHVQDTQADKIFRDSQHRIRSMALIHEKLYRSENLAGIDFAEYVRDLALSLFRSYNAGAQGIALAMRADSVFLGIDKAVPCGLLLNELIANSLKHAFPADRDGPDAQAGQIRIELYAAPEGQVTLVVGDNGVGLPPDLDVHNTTSLGLQLIHTLANQLGGTVQLGRDQGTEFKITFVAQEPVKK